LPGQISAEKLILSIPSVSEIANIETVQLCNINSDDITGEIWTQLAHKINEIAERDDVSGIVVTHGTDTLEETAYFLNLTVKTEKPVIVTGSMRPSTAVSADGNMNLYEAVAVAACGNSVGRGVLVVFSDRIFSARAAIKSSTYCVSAFTGGESGIAGIIRDSNVFYYSKTEKLHTVNSEFTIKGLNRLPNANLARIL
jgi:L-asparaginase